MGTLSEIGHPSFCPPFRNSNLTSHASGGGTAEPPDALRWGGSFHQFGSPFLEGRGAVWVIDQGRDERAETVGVTLCENTDRCIPEKPGEPRIAPLGSQNGFVKPLDR